MTTLETPPLRAPEPTNSSPQKEPLWLLRINPLSRVRLADHELRGLLARLEQAERDVRFAADRCSEELYALIGETTEDTVRGQLIAARRAIHNDRPLRNTLPGIPSVAEWCRATEDRRQVREEAARQYEPAADRERQRIADVLGDEHLRSSLALVSPEVYQESERYRAAVAGPGRLSARSRKSERGLLQYVTRAMVRTSPLARFTAVGIAVPGPGGVDPGSVEFGAAEAFPSLDRVMVNYVLGGLPAATGSELLGAWVSLAPTSALDEGRETLYFLRPAESGFQRLSAPVKGIVSALVDATVMGPRPVRSVVAHLVEQTGCTAQAAAKAVLQGVHQGILCTYNEPEDGAADLERLLSRPGAPGAELLDDVRSRLPRLSSGPVEERRRELDAIEADFAQLGQLARRPARVTIEEDFVLPPTTVDSSRWRRPLADLGPTVELLSVFDWLHDVRILTTAAFVQRFGPGASVPLAEHAASMVQEISRRAALMAQSYASGDNGVLDGLGTADGSLQQLFALRRRIIEETQSRITQAVDSGASDVCLTALEAAELTAGLPERIRRDPMSYGVLVQAAGDRLVFNDGLPGHGMLYSRFLDADRSLSGEAIPYLADRLTERYAWDGARVVEERGLHRLNVNAHPHILPEGMEPDDWFALRLVHDTASDTLRIEDAEGRRTRVLPLGTGHPGLFPPPLSLATSLTTGGRLNNDLLNGWFEARSHDRQHTLVCPRLSVGDVLLSRRRWYGGADLTAALGTGPAEHDRLLALTAWRARHGVPEEVVLKTTFGVDSPRTLDPADVLPRRLQHKPQYVDLASALSTRVLPKMLDRRATTDESVDYLEEALPSVVEGTHAHEWVVEIGRRPGGPFHYEGENR
ncbi:lantibiotic dehydratase family protein [Streptomyces sp. NBC_00006]|uniref:lantibiotic dehydratase n=1 Tax=unclassified Streptomyces TaxID=2593676 RepID=UPI00224DFDDA|nr:MULTISPECIES: lantibiotic dehydratase [unclassified Streptomyces]MCX4834194.1 lantibiotic dehydratase family protein [Streptomyces sp. NBC_01016]MCX5529895.1 lantibiotic dehydratase family protein [Streptomyces sp. NBC_00006]